MSGRRRRRVPKKAVTISLDSSAQAAPLRFEFESAWKNELSPALSSVLSFEKTTDASSPRPLLASREATLRSVARAVSHGFSSELRAELDKAVLTRVRQVVGNVAATDDSRLCDAAAREWSALKKELGLTRSLFLPLDDPSHAPLWQSFYFICESVFRKDFPNLARRLVSRALDSVSRERRHRDYVNFSVQDVVAILRALNLHSEFDSAYQRQLRVFWEKEKHSWTNDSFEFCTKACEAYEYELKKARIYVPHLNSSKALDGSLLSTEILEKLINDVLKPSLDARNYESLIRLYELVFKMQAKGIEILTEHAIRYAKSCVEEIFEEARDLESDLPGLVVPKLFELIDVLHVFSYKALVEAYGRCCDSSKKRDLNSFRCVIDSVDDRGLRIALNSFSTKSKKTKLDLTLASYLDKHVLRNSDKVDRFELESRVDKSLVLFRFLQEKDMFEAFHKEFLARRMLDQTSESRDLEKQVVMGLKKECGSSFVSKMESMFRDLDLALDQAAEYSPARVSKCRVLVLSSGCWPDFSKLRPTDSSSSSAAVEDMNYDSSPQLRDEMENFSSWYESRHEGRRLTFQPSASKCIMKFVLGSTSYELEVNTNMALVLLLFESSSNSDEKILSFEFIMGKLKMDSNFLKLALESLSTQARHLRILTKISANETDRKKKIVQSTDSFKINSKFKSRRRRVVIHQVSPPDFVSSRDVKVHEDVEGDRKRKTDAAIMRVLKTRKRLGKTDLEFEVLRQLSSMTKIDVSLIEARVEDLIQREYLERDPDEESVLVYVA